MENILPISLKLNFTPNTLGCYRLNNNYGFSLISLDAHHNFRLPILVSPLAFSRISVGTSGRHQQTPNFKTANAVLASIH